MQLKEDESFCNFEHSSDATAAQDSFSLGQASKSIFVTIQTGNTFLKE